MSEIKLTWLDLLHNPLIELSLSDRNVSLGIYCDKLGVFQSVLDNILEKKNNESII